MAILCGFIVYAVFVALVLVFNYGAHKNETNEEQGE